MLDAVDKVIVNHLRSIVSTLGGKGVSVFSIATADQDDQPYVQAAQEKGKEKDKVEFPFIGLVRLPGIDISDYNQTKRVHLYDGYKLSTGENIKLTYYRCTLHYSAAVFAENRKLAEDIATALYGKLRNYCQVSVSIRLPIEVDKEKNLYAAAVMDVDIEMGPTIEQTLPITSEKAQVYKTRLTFDVKNVNIYDVAAERSYKYNVYVEPVLESGQSGERELAFSSDKDKQN